jgi:hypothetical protein
VSYQDDLADKQITVWIDRAKGTPLCALELKIVAASAPIDHIFRFNEICSRATRLSLRNVYGSAPPANRPFLHSTYK